MVIIARQKSEKRILLKMRIVTASIGLKGAVGHMKYNKIKDLKPNTVFLCEGQLDGCLYVTKKTKGPKAIEQYQSVYQRYNDSRCDARNKLYLPRYVETENGEDVFEFIDGTIMPWSENENSPAFGGALIPTETVQDIIELSIDLDRLAACNQDFYWRNFVFMPGGKIGLIDWENVALKETEQVSVFHTYIV